MEDEVFLSGVSFIHSARLATHYHFITDNVPYNRYELTLVNHVTIRNCNLTAYFFIFHKQSDCSEIGDVQHLTPLSPGVDCIYSMYFFRKHSVHAMDYCI